MRNGMVNHTTLNYGGKGQRWESYEMPNMWKHEYSQTKNKSEGNNI